MNRKGTIEKFQPFWRQKMERWLEAYAPFWLEGRKVKSGKKSVCVLLLSIIICIFAADLVTQRTVFFRCNGIRICSLGVKRESGESPEQSRCCELFHTAAPQKRTTVRRHSRMGRPGRRGASQKTCQVVTEQAPSMIKSFRGKSWKSMVAKCRHAQHPFSPVSLRKLFWAENRRKRLNMITTK